MGSGSHPRTARPKPRPRRGHLNELRRAWGLTWPELGALCRIDTRWLKRLDTGRVDRMSLGTVMRVAVTLGVPCSEILPLLAAKPSRNCLAAAWVAKREEAKAEAKALLLGQPVHYPQEHSRDPAAVTAAALDKIRAETEAATLRSRVEHAVEPEALAG